MHIEEHKTLRRGSIVTNEDSYECVCAKEFSDYMLSICYKLKCDSKYNFLAKSTNIGKSFSTGATVYHHKKS